MEYFFSSIKYCCCYPNFILIWHHDTRKLLICVMVGLELRREKSEEGALLNTKPLQLDVVQPIGIDFVGSLLGKMALQQVATSNLLPL